jgi:hypothetical protein
MNPHGRLTRSFGELVHFVNTDAGAVASKWATRTSAASQDYVDGVTSTDKDPTALAIAAIPRMRSRVLESIDSGKVAAGLRRVGKQGWIAAVQAKGAANFSSGVQAAEGKVAAAFAPLLAFESNLQRQVQAMPANTDAEREAKMLAWVRGMRTYQAPS